MRQLQHRGGLCPTARAHRALEGAAPEGSEPVFAPTATAEARHPPVCQGVGGGGGGGDLLRSAGAQGEPPTEAVVGGTRGLEGGWGGHPNIYDSK